MRIGILGLVFCAVAAFPRSSAAEPGDGAPDGTTAADLDATTASEPVILAQTADEATESEPTDRPPPRRFEDYATTNAASTGGPDGTATPAPDWRRLTEAELLTPAQTFPHVEWHGYFRFRSDTFWNLDLDTMGTSPILPPLEALIAPDSDTDYQPLENGSSDLVATDRERLASANVRFRLRPIFHITEKLRIHLEMNILDNLVLGSTPDGYNERRPGAQRPDQPLIAFTGSQEPPNAFNAGRESISVTQAYGEVNTFFGTIRLGRMASHWGLGILANGGGNYTELREPRASYRGLSMSGHTCMDCDYGDYVDRAMFVTNVLDTYLVLAWDWNSIGPTNLDPIDYYGQPRDISQADDVNSVAVALFRRPLRNEEIAARNRTLKELRRPALDWGAYFVYRRQNIDFGRFSPGDPPSNSSQFDPNFRNREARAYIPDVWFRLTSEPRFRTRLRLEGELAMIFGNIGNADPGSPSDEKERTVRQIGAAMEFEYVRNALATGLNAGLATGRTFEGQNDEAGNTFGVIDDWSIRDDEPVITNFKFDRNYFVDAIMFREIIGTITNAVYFNPFFSYDLFSKQDDNLGLRLDVITALAMNPDATPSGQGFYGVETDLTIYYREPRYGADIMGGVYIPGAAFNARAGRVPLQSIARIYDDIGQTYDSRIRATPAWTLQGRFFWAF